MGKLRTMVWSQTERNSALNPKKSTVAHRLMVGHMRATVTPARTRVTRMGLSAPGLTWAKAMRWARGSRKKKLITKQMGSMMRSSISAGSQQALDIPPRRKAVLYSSMASTMKKHMRAANTTS